MKGAWKVTSNIFDGGVKKYAVYRLLDVNEVDHSGNREFAGGYIDDKDLAQSIAGQLNAQDSPDQRQ